MLIDFLKSLVPVIEEEKSDFNDVINALMTVKKANFMPSITFDLWPVFSLQCSETIPDKCNDIPNVYIISIGEAEFFFKHELERILSNFYNDDDFEVQHTYGGELEEMILLSSSLFNEKLHVTDITDATNVAYMRFALSNGELAHLFFVLSTTVDAWSSIFEKYKVACSVLIDSHKGFGDWMESTPFWNKLKRTANSETNPTYYFKGKFISNEAPVGFEYICDVKESRKNECVSKFYRTNL